VTNQAAKGKDEAVDGIKEDPQKKKGLLTPGVEDALGGHALGQYQLLARLGRGGMATVYKAYQPSLDRYVAVKVLSTFLAQNPDFAARFQREARAIAKLNHPNILPVYDYGQEGELTYIVMRYVEGGTLQDMLDKLGQPLGLERAVEIIAQMGEALDYAHGQGIVHRDVKPSNVLMADGSWALLSDFGLARMVGGSARITQTGVGMGTPAYIAPEQARDTRVDVRSDIYSLGVVLFEMLTGQVPFQGDSYLVVLFKLVNDPPPLPRGINPDIPQPVEQVLLKALAKEPIDRFQRAGEMVTALQKAVTEGPLVTATVSLGDEKGQQEARLASLYAEATRFLEAKEWQKALEKWAEVQAIDLAYPDPQEVVTRARKGLAELEATISPVELVLPVKEETVPIWRRVPVWAWAAVAGVILLVAVAGATLSPRTDSELSAVVAPTSTPMPATPTPTADVAATETALAGLAADVVATEMAKASATMGASNPTPTDTPTATNTPTETPVPATATPKPTRPPAPTATPTPAPTTTPQPGGSILTIYLRDTPTETGFATLSADQPDGGMIYEEGRFVYGEAAVQIGDTVYHFDEEGEPEQLPEPWQVEFEFAEVLLAHTGNQEGFDADKAQFWVGTLDSESALGEDTPYSLTIRLYEGSELRESLQVSFTVADAAEAGGGGDGGGKPPYIPP